MCDLVQVSERPRVCAAVLRESPLGPTILMVRHPGFWTLPGGGVEAGESWETAARRELREETGLVGQVLTHLWTRLMSNDDEERCYLMDVGGDSEPAVGIDPELTGEDQVILGVAWMSVDRLRYDEQVSRVLASLEAHR